MDKIHSYLDSAIDYYKTGKVEITQGLEFSQAETIKTIEFYSNSQYLSGNKDNLGREKPFYNISNFRVRVAKTASDIDIKDIKVEADKPKFFAQSMLINNELFKWMKESNFSRTLNEMGETRPRYGGVLVKKTEEKVDGEKKLKIDVVEWKNVYTDTNDILSLIVECHYMDPSEFSKKKDVWDNVEEVLAEFTKKTKGKYAGEKIEVYEVHGEFPESMYEEGGDDSEYKKMKFYIAGIGKKKFTLFKDYEDELPYMYLPWEKVSGRGLGRGVVEEGFEAQVWTNDSIMAIKDAMDLAGKVILYTDSAKIGGRNALADVDNGHIFELEQGKTLSSLNLIPSALPEFQNLINLWKDQYDRTASTFDANTGEQAPSGTPYSQTALLNQVANTPFAYQREVWGIFLNELINKWVFPFLIKQMKDGHTLVVDFTDDELKIIDESFGLEQANREYVKKILSGEHVYMEDYLSAIEGYKAVQQSLGRKRYIEIPDNFFDDLECKVTINITGEQKNKAAMLQSLNTILTTVAQNPNILQDPTLYKIFGSIVEMSGVPLSPLQLKPSEQMSSPAQGGQMQQNQQLTTNDATPTI
jgi:hypothetical protein